MGIQSIPVIIGKKTTALKLYDGRKQKALAPYGVDTVKHKDYQSDRNGLGGGILII